MEIERIKEILEAIKETDIEEITIERGGEKTGFKKQGAVSNSVRNTRFVSEENIGQKVSFVNPMPSKFKHIHSPMVGTFFRRLPSSTTTLVNEGDFVTVGQKVGIIEAMRIIKEITSPIAGKIVQALVEDNSPVEYGQPLFEVEPQQAQQEAQEEKKDQ